MFIAALFTIAKTWKQPKGSSTEEWIKKMWCTFINNEYGSFGLELSISTTIYGSKYKTKAGQEA